MADDLKRVGIAFSAEGAEDFKRSLKEISAATKENYSELKLAQSQYDKNTTTSQKLADKQKYLAGQADVYKEKIKILNKQLEEMEKDENADRVAIEKKKTEINQAQTKLNGYEKSLEEVTKEIENHSDKLEKWGQNLEDIGGKMKGFGDKAQAVGGALTKGVTAPIVGIAGASVAAWKEVDNAMDIITTKTGASGAALEDMQSRAKNIAQTIPTDFETAANAVGEVNTRFKLTGDELEALSTQFVQFAAINNTDVSSSVDNVSQTLQAFGQSTSDAGSLLDAMTKVSQDTGISVDTLSGLLSSNAAELQAMGYNAQSAASFLGQCEMSGMDVSTAMAGMKKAMQNATKEGGTLQGKLKEFDGVMKSNKSETEKLQYAYETFGKKGGAAIYNAAKNGTLDITSLGDSFSEFGGTVANTYEGTLDPLDQLTTILNSLKELGGELVEAAAPLIKDVLEKVRDIVTTLKEKWEALTPQQQESIEKFAALAAVIGPVITVIGGLANAFAPVVSGIGSVLSALGVGGAAAGAGGAAAAGGGLVGALAAGGPVILAIMAVIAVIALLVTHWDEVKEAVGKFKDAIVNAWNNIKEKAAEIWGKIKETVSNAVKAIKDTVTNIFNGIKSFFSNTWNNIKGAASKAWNGIKSTLGTVWNGIKTTAQNAFNGVKNTIGTAWNGVKSVTGTAVNAVKSTASSAWNTLKSNTSAAFSGIKSLITGDMDGVKRSIGTILGNINSTINTGWNNLKSVTSAAFTAVKNTASAAWQGIYNTMPAPIQKAMNFMKNAVSKLKNLFKFKWKLPDLQLPHISIKWTKLGPLKVPKFDVKWYAQAYDAAAYYDSPTVRADGRGFGDRTGGEFAVGERHLQETVAAAVSAKNKEILTRFDDVINAVSTLADSLSNVGIYLDNGQLVGALATGIGSELTMNTKRSR